MTAFRSAMLDKICLTVLISHVQILNILYLPGQKARSQCLLENNYCSKMRGRKGWGFLQVSGNDTTLHNPYSLCQSFQKQTSVRLISRDKKKHWFGDASWFFSLAIHALPHWIQNNFFNLCIFAFEAVKRCDSSSFSKTTHTLEGSYSILCGRSKLLVKFVENLNEISKNNN